MAAIDWIIVAVFLATTTGIGLWFARRASRNMDEYFVAGRKLPWWLAGTSILSGSFASDTPLHTTKAIREGGLPGGWFYWNGIVSGLVIALVFSRLWRRAGVVTDNEFIELRYTGKRAAVLRGSMAVLRSLFLEILTMAWITLGMAKIVQTIMGLPKSLLVLDVSLPTEVVVVAALVAFTVAFSVASGAWGVVATDVLEFAVAMIGAIVLAVVAMVKVGGVSGLREGLAAKSTLGEGALDLLPNFEGTGGMTPLALGIYMTVLWWANGQDGNGAKAQRYLSCKNDNQAIAAGIWSIAVQWVLRSWPWYVTALCSLVLYPTLTDHETAYPIMVAELLPIGLKGLMVASFFAAFMGTMETHYNLTASYAVNDVYKRFISKERSAQHYVKAARWTTLGVAALAAGVTLLLTSVMGAFRFKMELLAGLGLIYILRWVWWRVNATTELVALVTSIGSALFFNALPLTAGGGATGSALRLLWVVLVSAATASVATLLTAPEPKEHLLAFYRKVLPPRLLWEPIAREAGEVGASGFGLKTVGQLLLAISFVFATMIGLGKVILGDGAMGLGLLAFGAVAGLATLRWVFATGSTSTKPTAEPAAGPGLAG